MAATQSDGEYRGNNENRGFWSIDFGNSPVIGTAIHDGHFIRMDIADLMALSPEKRLRGGSLYRRDGRRIDEPDRRSPFPF